MVMVTCKADTQCCATGRRHKPGKVLRDNSGRSRASASAQGTRHRPDIFFQVIFIAFDCRHQFLFSAGPNYYWLLHKEQLSFLHISQKIQMFNIFNNCDVFALQHGLCTLMRQLFHSKPQTRQCHNTHSRSLHLRPTQATQLNSLNSSQLT